MQKKQNPRPYPFKICVNFLWGEAGVSTGEIFSLVWKILVLAFLIVETGTHAAEPATTSCDPLVMKIYPDGTQLIQKWSEIGQKYDDGASHGGPPKIVAYRSVSEGSSEKNENGTTKVLPSQLVGYGPEEASLAQEGFYFMPTIGGAVVQDEIGYGGDVNYTFNAGVRFDLSMGYRVNEWFSIEFTPGFIYNSLESITVQGIQYNVSGELIQVPLLINPILTIPTGSKWEPFLGFGVGGVYTSQSNSSFGFYSSGTTTAWNFCYSGLVGLQYHLEQNISVGFIYKFTGINQSGTNYDDLLTQSVEANATFRF